MQLRGVLWGRFGHFFDFFGFFGDFFGHPRDFFGHFWTNFGHFLAIFGPFFDPRKIGVLTILGQKSPRNSRVGEGRRVGTVGPTPPGRPWVSATIPKTALPLPVVVGLLHPPM